MLIEDVRARLRERLSSLGMTATTKAIKDRLGEAGLSEKYLDQLLVSRKPNSPPIDPTITKIELVAKALDVSLPWLICGVGRPEAMFAPKQAPRGAEVVGDLQARINKKSPPAQGVRSPRKK